MKRELTLGILGGSFIPPGRHHCGIAQQVLDQNMVDALVIVPCGGRPQKGTIGLIPPKHRRELMRRGFPIPDRAVFDFFDLKSGVYTPTHQLQKRYEQMFPSCRIVHIIGYDLAVGGSEGKSEIQISWVHGSVVFEQLEFLLIVPRPNCIETTDYPPHCRVCRVTDIRGRSTVIRNRRKAGKSISQSVMPGVKEYLDKHALLL